MDDAGEGLEIGTEPVRHPVRGAAAVIVSQLGVYTKRLTDSKLLSTPRCRNPKTRPAIPMLPSPTTAKRSPNGGNAWVLTKLSTSTRTARRPPNASTPWCALEV